MAVNVGTAIAYLNLDATNFNTGLANAQSALQNLNNGTGSLSKVMGATGTVLANTGTALTNSITLPLISAGKEIISFSADFDKQMSSVEAVMQNVLRPGDMERLRQAAIDWGEQTVYTATEAAEALYYMGLAGWDVDQALGGLGAVLNLAAAGNLDLGRASDIVTDSMTAMNLTAGQTTNGIENTAYYTSVLAAVMANANTDVDKMGESFKYVAPIAGQLGYNIEDLGLALGLAANAGIKSSQAGTSLRQALKQLISPTDKTADAMKKYGITLFDAQGNALPFRQIMLQLQKTFGDLGVEVLDTNGDLKEGEAVMEEYGNSLPISQQEKLQAVVDLFGTRAMPTMLAIIQQAGGEFDKLANAIDEAAATGTYASEMAETQLDNLAGDWTRFTSALGTTKIMLEEIVDGWLRNFVQQLTEFVKKFNELDTAQKEQIIKWGLVAAAVGPVLTIIGRLMTTFATFASLVGTLSTTFSSLVSGFTGVAGAAGGVEGGFGGILSKIGQLGAKANWIIAIIMLVITAIVDLWKNSEQFRNWVKDAFQSLFAILKKAWSFIQRVLDVLNEMWMALARAIEPIVEVLVAELSPALDAVGRVLGAIFDILAPILELIRALFVKLMPLVEFVAGIVAGIIGVVSEIVTWLVDKVGWLLEWIVKGIEWLKYVLIGDPIIIDLIEGVKSIVQLGLEFLKNLIQFFVDTVIQFVTWLWEKGTELVNNLIEGIKTIWQEFIDWFQDIWSNFVSWLSNAWETLSTGIQNAWNTFVTWITEMWNKFTDWLKESLRAIGEHIRQAIDAFHRWLEQTITKIKQTAERILQAIFDTAQRVWNNIVAAFERAKQHIQDGIEKIRQKFEELKEAIHQKFEEIKENIQRKFEEVREKLENLGEMLREKFEAIVQNIKEHFAKVVEKIKEFGRNFVQAWKDAFANVQKGIASVFNHIRNGFEDFGKNVFGIAKNVGNAFIKGLLGTGRNIKDFFTNFIKSAVEGLLRSLKAFKETGALIMQNLWNGIKEKWKAFTEWLKEMWDAFLEGHLFASLWDSIKGALTGNKSNVKSAVNGSHANGLAYVPFNGYIAELHQGERVLTAEENQRYSSGANSGTTINFYSNEKIDEYTAAKELRRTIKDMELGLV